LFRAFAIGRKRLVDQMHRDLTNAWYVAALSRQQKLPPLQKLLRRDAPTKQSPHDMRTALVAISKAYGLRLRRKEPRGE
jgi:hypothetical protein